MTTHMGGNGGYIPREDGRPIRLRLKQGEWVLSANAIAKARQTPLVLPRRPWYRRRLRWI